MIRTIILMTFLIICLILTGCPHQLVNMIEQNQKDGVYTPKPLINPSGRTSFSIEEKIKNDTANIPIYMEINIINSSEFPDKVEIIAVIRDSLGRFITGLAEPYLKEGKNYKDFWTDLTDSCENQKTEISDFKVREYRKNDAKPFAVSYVLDYSSSMGIEGIKMIQKSIPKILKISKPDDYVSVVIFSGEAVVEVPLESSTEYLKMNRKINLKQDSLKPGTKIKMGLDSAFQELSKSNDTCQRIIILISDGGDNFKTKDWDEITKQTREFNVKIYALSIGFSFGGDKLMKKLADISGGKQYQIFSFKEFPYVFADIFLELNNYYSITYSAPDCRNHHKVEPFLKLRETDNKISTSGYYDKSVFNEIDPVGTVSFVNIEFEFGKSEINPQSYPLINQVVDFLAENKSYKIRISGHTDDIGKDEDNLKLSRDRAEAVKNYIINKRIKPSRIVTVGFGETKPLVPNSNEANRRTNRRTEFEIIEK
ncbi:MAG: OmpA family protein [bacterium]